MIDLSFTVRELLVQGVAYRYYSLLAAAGNPAFSGLARLPFSLRILAENLLRHGHEDNVGPDMLSALASNERGFEISFRPARVLLQDLLGVPVMVDLAALREAIAQAGGDPLMVNPSIPVDFVIDHSIIADVSGSPNAARRNVEIEYARNRERFAFLAWCQGAFRNFRVVPPDSGIVHQINVERLARVVWTNETDGVPVAYPDTLVCNDSHSTMVNGIGVLGWGVGGIEAEAAMLGRSLSLRVPEVLGVRVTGELPPGATATDLVLTIAERLRRAGVVGKFVEFYGPGLDALPVTDRTTIANMAPEYGATCVFFPVDQKCIDYLAFTGRDAATVALARPIHRRSTCGATRKPPRRASMRRSSLISRASSARSQGHAARTSGFRSVMWHGDLPPRWQRWPMTVALHPHVAPHCPDVISRWATAMSSSQQSPAVPIRRTLPTWWLRPCLHARRWRAA
jgi:aconitate hydratase